MNRLFVKSDRSVSHKMLLLQNFQFLQNPWLRLAPELKIFFRCFSLLETLNFESRVLLGLEAVDSARQDGVVPVGKLMHILMTFNLLAILNAAGYALWLLFTIKSLNSDHKA